MSFSEQIGNIHGFGSASVSELAEMQKAIDGGYDVGGDTQTGGGAWRLEFLEKTLAVLAHQRRHIVFYNDIPKPTADSTAIEYARLSDYGNYQGGWYASGELPLSHDAEYDRNVALVKFLGDVREITMPFLKTKTLVDVRARVTESGTLWLLNQIERTLFKGNAKLGLNGAEFDEIDGLETYISRDASSDNVINLWGSPLEEGHIRNAGQVVIDANGIGTHIYAPSSILEDYSASYLKQQYIPTPVAGGGALAAGLKVDRLRTVGGDYMLRPLFRYKGLTSESPPTATNTRAPAPDPSVAITGLTGSGAEWANSLGLAATGDSGTVEYQVSYGNKYGESVPVVTAPTSQAITYANRASNVRLTITNPAFINAPTYFSVYRRDTDASGTVSSWGCVARVSLVSAAAGATQTWDDDGTSMPGTQRAWFGELTEDVIHLSQLLPFTRIPLPPLSLSERFALVMFVSLVLRAPNKWVEFRNIGRRTV